MPTINPERLLDDLKTLRSFGATGHGVVRRSLSAVDLASRQWLVERLTEAGLEARIDGIGSVFGHSPNPGKALLIGSHTDTQPTGGWLDGAMGVIYGLEVARAFSESAETRELAVDVASWIDEEGTYVGFLGSMAFCGEVAAGTLENAVNAEGDRLNDALARANLTQYPVAKLETNRYTGYLEAHIEQGPHLEAQKKRIGIVTSIVGMRDYRVEFRGQQNHAGTTPMALRRDAGATLIEFSHRVIEGLRARAGERTVYTIGEIDLVPGAASIIPGQAHLILQFRDPEESKLDALEAYVIELVRETNAGGTVAVEIAGRSTDAEAAAMDAGFQHHLTQAAKRHAPDDWVSMPSGAGHDAQVLAKYMRAGMLFVPSIGGISHDFAEDTSEDDVALGCQVMASAVASILQESIRQETVPQRIGR